MAFCRLRTRNDGYLLVRTTTTGCLVVRFDECDYTRPRPRVITVGVRRRTREDREARDMRDLRDILAAVLRAISRPE